MCDPQVPPIHQNPSKKAKENSIALNSGEEVVRVVVRVNIMLTSSCESHWTVQVCISGFAHIPGCLPPLGRCHLTVPQGDPQVDGGLAKDGVFCVAVTAFDQV